MGGFVQSIGDFVQNDIINPISHGLASLDHAVHNVIPGGWATVGAAALMAVGIYDPELLASAEEGSLTSEQLLANGVTQDQIGALTDTINALQPEIDAGNITASNIADLMQSGYAPTDISTLLSSGYTASDLTTLAGQGFDGANLTGLANAGYTADDIATFSQSGFLPEQISGVASAGINPTQFGTMVAQGLEPNTVQPFLNAGLTPEQITNLVSNEYGSYAGDLLSQGYTPEQLVSLSEAGYTGGEASSFLAQGMTPEEVSGALSNGTLAPPTAPPADIAAYNAGLPTGPGAPPPTEVVPPTPTAPTGPAPFHATDIMPKTAELANFGDGTMGYMDDVSKTAYNIDGTVNPAKTQLFYGTPEPVTAPITAPVAEPPVATPVAPEPAPAPVETAPAPIETAPVEPEPVKLTNVQTDNYGGKYYSYSDGSNYAVRPNGQIVNLDSGELVSNLPDQPLPVTPAEPITTPVSTTPTPAEPTPVSPQAPVNVTSTGVSDSAPGTIFNGPNGQEVVLDSGKTVNLADYQAAQTSGQPIAVDGQMTTSTTVNVSGLPGTVEHPPIEGTVLPEGTQLATVAQQGEALDGVANGAYYDSASGSWVIPKDIVVTATKLGITTPEVIALGGAAAATAALAAGGGGGAATTAATTPTTPTTPAQPAPVEPAPVTPAPAPVTPAPVTPTTQPINFNNGGYVVNSSGQVVNATTGQVMGTSQQYGLVNIGNGTYYDPISNEAIPTGNPTAPVTPAPVTTPALAPVTEPPLSPIQTAPPVTNPPVTPVEVPTTPAPVYDYSTPLTPEQAAALNAGGSAAGYSTTQLLAAAAAGYLLPSVLQALGLTPKPSTANYNQQFFPIPTYNGAGTVNPGVNPGFIQPNQFYGNQPPGMDQYYWGQHGYAQTMGDLANYNAGAVNAPAMPYGNPNAVHLGELANFNYPNPQSTAGAYGSLAAAPFQAPLPDMSYDVYHNPVQMNTAAPTVPGVPAAYGPNTAQNMASGQGQGAAYGYGLNYAFTPAQLATTNNAGMKPAQQLTNISPSALAAQLQATASSFGG